MPCISKECSHVHRISNKTHIGHSKARSTWLEFVQSFTYISSIMRRKAHQRARHLIPDCRFKLYKLKRSIDLRGFPQVRLARAESCRCSPAQHIAQLDRPTTGPERPEDHLQQVSLHRARTGESARARRRGDPPERC